VEATGAVGSAIATIGIPVSVTGVSAVGTVGSVTVGLGSVVFVAGVSAAGYVGSVLVWDQIIPNQDPNWIEIAA
jgi:hypothetical protein